MIHNHKIQLKLNLKLIGINWPKLKLTFDNVDIPLSYSGLTAHGQLLFESYNTMSVLELTIKDLDNQTQIGLDQLAFFNISDKRFLWAGTYSPEYPEPWASQQINLPKSYQNFTVLGWNGTWTLEVTHPIFTWMHKKLDLGTIYP